MEFSVLTILPIFFLPLAAFVINSFIVKRFTKLAVGISTMAIFGSFLYTIRIFNHFLGLYSQDFHVHKTFNWIDLSYGAKIFKLDLGIYLDNMSVVMLLMVTGVAFLIHVFSTFYMYSDKRFGRFFVYLSLFTSAMLGLVLSDNLLSVFIFWEIMGFCSYSLIGFYYEKEGAGNASIKAFMTTRVGDVFFLFGILAIWHTVGSVNFVDIYRAINTGMFDTHVFIFNFGIPLATLAGISIFLGTIGKSAQFPLQVWLPDAMWGPTPCSALIHAATMVAAGVYLSLRMFPLLEAGNLLTLVSFIGGITAFGAATIAVIQKDIKAVLAYSTISQLGYMVLGIGVGAYNAAFMHLITHAIFKACLFLSAGSVIHSLHDHHTDSHVQDMDRMGGLRKKMPYTFIAMLLCTFAITGMPFFSGFVSKDRILGEALLMATHSKVYIIPCFLGFLGALLTAFYMFRMMYMTFFGPPKDLELHKHVHSEHLSWNQNIPLLVLALFTFGFWFSGSVTGQGLIKVTSKERYEWFDTLVKKPNITNFSSYERSQLKLSENKLERLEQVSVYDSNHGMSEEDAHYAHFIHKVGAILSVIIFLIGVSLATFMYLIGSVSPLFFLKVFKPWNKALENKYYFDELYVEVLIKKVFLKFNSVLAKFDMGIFDRFFIDGWEKILGFMHRISGKFDNVVIDGLLVDGTGASVRLFNVVLRTVQNGKLQFYVVVALFSLAGYILGVTSIIDFK